MSSSWAKSFTAGVAAGGAALLVSFLLRELAGVPFLPEMGAQTLFSVTPGSIESGAVENLGSYAKYSAFAGAIIVNLGLYGVIGLLLTRHRSFLGDTARLKRGIAFFLASFAVLLAVGTAMLVLTQILTTPVTAPGLILSLIPPQIVFGVVLVALQRNPQQKPLAICHQPASPVPGKRFDRRRRLFIKTGVATAVAAAILAYGVGFLLLPRTGVLQSGTSSSLSLAQGVTPNDRFYRVDVNITPPLVSPNSWNLAVAGLVDRPLALSLDQIINMALVEQYNTLECVSNEIGGDLISTAKWRGVRLKDILQMAGLQSGAQYMVFKCVDGYDVGIPVDRALLDGTILAFEMNGQPLPQEHGYPLRAVVPGLYGMMNAKWITRIEAVNGMYEGYWQRRGWTNDARHQTGSDVVVPGTAKVTQRFGIQGSNSVLLGKVPIAGIAFGGDRGISKVEVSMDGGDSWTTASLKDPLSDYTWVLWSAEWNPPRTGSYKLMVRATDGRGNIQTATVTNPFPNGATGYQVVDISVVSS